LRKAEQTPVSENIQWLTLLDDLQATNKSAGKRSWGIALLLNWYLSHLKPPIIENLH
jgi:hypothetical protein